MVMWVNECTALSISDSYPSHSSTDPWAEAAGHADKVHECSALCCAVHTCVTSVCASG